MTVLLVSSSVLRTSWFIFFTYSNIFHWEKFFVYTGTFT